MDTDQHSGRRKPTRRAARMGRGAGDPRRRGTALVLSLIVVMLIAGLGAGLIQMQTSTGRRYAFAIDRRSALYLAEAGLGEAALAVSLGKSGIIADETTPVAFGGGVYWVESEDLPDDRIILTCTAQVGTAEIVARTLIVPNVNPVAKLGFFGLQRVELGAGTVVDGYHSGRGTYLTEVDPMLPVTATGEHGLVGSDGDVVLLAPAGSSTLLVDLEADEDDWLEITERAAGETKDKDKETRTRGDAGSGSSSTVRTTQVYGFIRPGRASVVQSDGTALISEGIRPFESPPFVPEVTLPAPAEVLTGPLTITGVQADIGLTGETEVSGDVIVESGAVLTLYGPSVVLLDALIVASGGTLQFDDSGGPIQLYSRTGIQLRRGSFLTSLASDESARGTRLSVWGDSTARDRLELEATGTFHGMLYAPDDVVRIPNTLRWIGGAVARVIESDEESHLTFDRRLAIGGDGLPALPQLLAWQIVPLGDTIARRLNLDPLVDLRRRGVTPLRPSDGPPEVEVALQYLDSAGSPTMYEGPIAGFSPALAVRIVGARWDDPRDGVPREWATPPGTESTGALESVREDLASIRTAIVAEAPASDVSVLSDDEALIELAAVVEAGTLVTTEPAVERAVDRADDAAVDERQSHVDRAAEAARTALALAEEGEALLAEIMASPMAAAPEEEADDVIKGLTKESENARKDADHARDDAIEAAQPDSIAEKAADKAEDRLAKTEAHMVKVKEYYDELKGMGF
ncbi:MAG: hypothetical protein AAGG01_01155 [Planctomycetota bacterium]